jgi:hypothetical protein
MAQDHENEVKDGLEDLEPKVDPKGGETKTKSTTTTQETYLKYELENVQITSYQLG